MTSLVLINEGFDENGFVMANEMAKSQDLPEGFMPSTVDVICGKFNQLKDTRSFYKPVSIHLFVVVSTLFYHSN